MIRLLMTPPQQACMWIQVTHDLIEFQTLGSWAPLYLHEVLGVPLGAVGSYTIWPMLCGMIGKLLVTGWESSLVAGGMHRLRLRKVSTAICSSCIFIFVPLFTLAPTPLLATLAYCGVSIGGCFEYPGFIGKYSINRYRCNNPQHSDCLDCSGGQYQYVRRIGRLLVLLHTVARTASCPTATIYTASCESCPYRITHWGLACGLAAVLCCAVLCCAVLCCAVLCCAVLCCAVLCCAVLCCAVCCMGMGSQSDGGGR
jgi:hypothetical protein